MSAPFAWPFVTTIPVRFRDLDALGHVNNAVYATYLEQARTDCYLALLGRTDPLARGAGLDFVVARAELDYVAPVRYGDALAVTVRPVHVGRSSFTLAYEGRRLDGAIAVRGRTVLVAYDWDAGRSRPIPAELARRLDEGVSAGEESP